MLKDDRYTYRVTWSEDDQQYVGLCAEFPSLSWLASNHDGALNGIRQAVAGTVEDMENAREPIPTPLATKSFSGKFIVRVPPEQHRDLAIQAAEQGVSLNRLASTKLAR